MSMDPHWNRSNLEHYWKDYEQSGVMDEMISAVLDDTHEYKEVCGVVFEDFLGFLVEAHWQEENAELVDRLAMLAEKAGYPSLYSREFALKATRLLISGNKKEQSVETTPSE